VSASDRWRAALATWAIPKEILAAAPESPWHFPVSLFADRAGAARTQRSVSSLRALEALPEGGEVLDVGCGAGAASLPLAERASKLTGVDSDEAMLDAFREQCEQAGVPAETIHGRWPDVADRAAPADVVVCHHVAYNAADLDVFALRLTDHARRRVVLELTQEHPLANLNPLWLRFHGVVRPTAPTADDAVAVLSETGLGPHREDWQAPRPGGYRSMAEMVAHVRRLLCLPAERDAEIEEELRPIVIERDGRFSFPDRPVATLWWDGRPGVQSAREGSGG